MGFLLVDLKLPAVESQKHVCGEEGNALVAVDKGMVHQQRLELGGRHFDDVLVIPGTRPKEGTLQKSKVTSASSTTKPLDEALVDGDHFIQAQVPDMITRQDAGPVPCSGRWRIRDAEEPRGARASD